MDIEEIKIKNQVQKKKVNNKVKMLLSQQTPKNNDAKSILTPKKERNEMSFQIDHNKKSSLIKNRESLVSSKGKPVKTTFSVSG